MPRRLPRSLRCALIGVKATITGTIVIAGLASQPTTSGGPAAGYAGYPVGDAPPPEQRLLDRHECSVSGFDDATPTSAIVRTAAGRLRHVSFDEGWEVYARHGQAQLVAVCLAEAPGQS